MLELDQLQDGVSLYNDSLQEKETEKLDDLDDSLCGDEDMKENDCVVPDKEDLTQVTSSDSITEHLVNSEKNCSLVDELFDDLPVASQTATGSDNIVSTLNESFDKKIAPLFSSTKKKKRFRTPVQSIVDENKCKQVDITNVQSSDTKAKKAKPVFKSAAKSSIGKKRKLPEISKDGDEKISEPPVKSDKKKVKSEATSTDETKEISEEVKSGKKVSSTTSLKASSVVEKANKKKRQKKATEDTEDDQPSNIDETNEASEEGMVVSSKNSGKKVSSATSEETAEKANKKKRQKKATEGTEEANSIKKASTCKQPDEGKTDDTKTEKAKPLFKPGTKKQKPSETSKGGKEKTSEPLVKSDTNKENCCLANTDIDTEINFNIKEDSTNDSTAGKTNKKKRQKKATEDKEATNNGIKKSKKEADASIKKAAQQQAKIDKSFKNLDREQRKAEKELQKISRELKKVRQQKSNKDKETVETYQPSHSGSSGQLWVQCDRPDCLKWRRLRDCKNPSEIPEQWFCSMNPGECYIRVDVHIRLSSQISSLALVLFQKRTVVN